MRVTKRTANTQAPQTPWKSIFTSVPVWAVVVTCFCNNWGFYTLLTCLPTYFNDVLRFSIEDVSAAASLWSSVLNIHVLSLSHTHTHTLSLSHSLSLSLTHSLSISLSLTLSRTLTVCLFLSR